MKIRETVRAPRKKRGHVCPWRVVYLFDNFLRPLLHNTEKLFGSYVEPGMTVLDIGCGRGFASLGLARLVGEHGRVISADVQPKMLAMVEKRAARAGLGGRIRVHRAEHERVGISEKVDFALAFWMLHETPDFRALIREVFELLKPGGRFYIVEPKVHTDVHDLEDTIKNACEVGFSFEADPPVRFSRAVVLQKPVSDRD